MTARQAKRWANWIAAQWLDGDRGVGAQMKSGDPDDADERKLQAALVEVIAELERRGEVPPWERPPGCIGKAPAVALAAKKGPQATRRNPRRLKTGT